MEGKTHEPTGFSLPNYLVALATIPVGAISGHVSLLVTLEQTHKVIHMNNQACISTNMYLVASTATTATTVGAISGLVSLLLTL